MVSFSPSSLPCTGDTAGDRSGESHSAAAPLPALVADAWPMSPLLPPPASRNGEVEDEVSLAPKIGNYCGWFSATRRKSSNSSSLLLSSTFRLRSEYLMVVAAYQHEYAGAGVCVRVCVCVRACAVPRAATHLESHQSSTSSVSILRHSSQNSARPNVKTIGPK